MTSTIFLYLLKRTNIPSEKKFNASLVINNNRMKRQTFSLKYKLEMVKEFRPGICLGESIGDLTRQFNIDWKTINRWLQDEKRYKTLQKNLGPKARQVHPGHEGY